MPKFNIFLTAMMSIGTFFFSFSVSQATCDKPLVMGYESYPPYMIVDKKGHMSGIDVDVVRAVGKMIGCEIEFVPRPWPRHLLELRMGSIDLASSANYNAARDLFAYYPTAYLPSQTVLVVSSDQQVEYAQLTDFLDEGKILGITLDHDYGELSSILLDEKYGAVLDESTTVEHNLQKLLSKHNDGILADRFMALYMAKKAGVRTQIQIVGTVADTPAYFMLSKQSVPMEVYVAFNHALEKLLASGELQQIFDQYTK